MIASTLVPYIDYHPPQLEARSARAWTGHQAFAAWLTEQIRPNIIVELGTHTGASYFAFCESVLKNNLATKTYAIDTWAGDEHAGFYDDTIFTTVDQKNRTRYGDFSTLIRADFNRAVHQFADGSINILHIDGLHTYEAVSNDFFTWLPKIAPEGLILFHDTQVRRKDFGVWKLWKEICAEYPNHLEFPHSNGLGVLQLAVQENTLSWLKILEYKELILGFFQTCGEISKNLDMLARIGTSQNEASKTKQSIEIEYRNLQIRNHLKEIFFQ